MKSVLLTVISFLISHSAAYGLSLTSFEKKLNTTPEDSLQFLSPVISLKTLKKIVAQFKLQRILQHQSKPWVHGIASPAPFHTQKLIIPATSTVIFFGDLHGNPHSLMRMLRDCQYKNIIDERFKIKKPDTYFVFLGDYVDRGFFSVELLSLVLSFANSNPENVILLRGNHEDALLNKSYGFYQELTSKYPSITDDEINDIQKLYTYLPAALYLGSGTDKKINFIQCCHGGLEIGYNPQHLFHLQEPIAYEAIFNLSRKESLRTTLPYLKKIVLQTIPEKEYSNCELIDPTTPLHNGFLWGDFIEDPNNYSSSIISFNQHRGWIIGKTFTQYFLNRYSTNQCIVRCIMRAHQHHGGMLDLLKKHDGFVTLYNGLVHTLISSPIPRTGISTDTYLILKMNPVFENWKLKPRVHKH